MVLEPNKYAYTLGEPDGWVFSFEQADSIGVRLLFLSNGENFTKSDSIMYVKEISGDLSAAFNKTISNAKYNNPAIEMEMLPSIPVKAGGRAEVFMLTENGGPRRAKEAFAFIEHTNTVVLVVLITKNAANWQNDYKAFEAVVSGHRFFDCTSPGRSNPCR